MSLLKKLNYRGQDPILILDVPEEARPLRDAFAGTTRVDESPAENVGYEFVLVFVRSAADVAARAPVVDDTAPDAVIWFAYPKKSSKRYRTDISRDDGWQPLGQRGYRPVRQVAIDDDWSALRFRHRDFVKR